MKKKILASAMTMVLAVSLGACQGTDIVGQTATTSFEKLINAVSDHVAADVENGGWALTAPDDSAKFVWSEDYSRSPKHDVLLEFSAEPFVAAGLDVTKLPENMIDNDSIIVGTKFGEDVLTYSGEITPLASFNQIVKLKRDKIGYHEDLDHYGVDLGGGNKFEWAKDMTVNDKDIVFVVDPQVFIEAGVDPSKVEGWVFAKVKMKDASGKSIEVDKFLKPFNIQ